MLRQEIQDKLIHYEKSSFNTIDINEYLKRIAGFKYSQTRYGIYIRSDQKDDVKYKRDSSKTGIVVSHDQKGRTLLGTISVANIRCFKCHKLEHYYLDYSKKKTLLIKEIVDQVIDSSVVDDDVFV